MKEVNIGMGKTVEQYIRTHGVRANRVLSVLGKNEQLINALQTPLGQELLKDVLELAEASLHKLLNIEIDASKQKFTEARCEYKSAIKLIERFLSKLNLQTELLDKVKNNKT